MATIKTNIHHTGDVTIETTIKAKISLTENDIFNWLNSCNNPDTLEYLGKHAIRQANSIKENKTKEIREKDVE